jgi:Fe-S-cluster containining protein
MNEILVSYRQLLADVDAWFARCQPLLGDGPACRGCAECCRGLFDVTLLDALLLRQGFDRLPEATRAQVLAKVRPILTRLQERFPGFAQPYLLSAVASEQLPLAGEEDTPCPLLDAGGRCLLYADRPLTCRLYGLPHIDRSGEIFLDEWCSHRLGERDPLAISGLRWEFRRTFAEEGHLLRALADRLALPAAADLDTLIPTALLIDVDRLRTLHTLALPHSIGNFLGLTIEMSNI